MYLGSVKFFKHLILTVFALLIIIPTIIAVAAIRGDAAKEKEINELKALVSTWEEFENDGKEFSPADFYELMERLGVKKEAFLALLYEKAPDILNEPANYTDEKPAPPALEGPQNNGATPSQVKPEASRPKNISSPSGPSSGSKPFSEYADIYPDLYVERYADESMRRYKDDKGYVYLTFDDGPSQHTPIILDYLRKHNVSATFFVIPNKNNSRFLNMILENGHAIGIHSASHDYNIIYSSVEAFLEDFKKAYDLVYGQTGIKPDIFRFPGGSSNGYNNDVREAIIKEMTRRGFVYFDWNVDSKDYVGASWTQMYNTVLKEVAENTAKGHRSIILMHDRPGGMNTVLVVEDIVIEILKDPNGYTFGKLDGNVRPVQFKGQ